MNPNDTREALRQAFADVTAAPQKLQKLHQQRSPERVSDYEFRTLSGTVRLSELFGGKDYLYVVHNMGKSCEYCTLWMDGFNGIADHLQNRVAFVVSSPDLPEDQEAFRQTRNWRFRMISNEGNSFAKDLGFESDEGMLMPGVSIFQRSASGTIERITETFFGPGDPYCGIFHLWALLPEGAPEWQPAFSYT